MRKQLTGEQLAKAFSVLKAMLDLQAETGGSIEMTNVPVVGGTLLDMSLKRKTENSRFWWEIGIDFHDGALPWHEDGASPHEAADRVWWTLCRNSEQFGY